MTIDWKKKLTSRKFWMALAGFVTGILVQFGQSPETADNIGGLILMGASVIAYAIGEGLADSQSITNNTENIYESDDQKLAEMTTTTKYK